MKRAFNTLLFIVAIWGLDDESKSILSKIGKFYKYGINVKQDKQEATRLYKVACKRDFLQGCSDLKKFKDLLLGAS